MDRRNFISNSLIGAGIAAAGAGVVQTQMASAEEKKAMTFGVGFLSDYTEHRVELAKELGYDCISVQMGRNKPYCQDLQSGDGVKKMQETFSKNGVSITSFADYANHLDANPDAREASSEFAHQLIDVAANMGVKIIAALCGRDRSKSIDESMDDFKKVWGPLVKHAEDKGIKYAFENWVGGNDISHGVNLAVCPYAWTKIFDAIDSPALGLEFDPSHLYWQGIDYLRAAREFSKKIFQVHLKDCIINPEDLYQRGHTGGSFQFCLPGWGDIKWPVFFRVLWQNGFRGNVVLEHEDSMYDDDRYEEGFRIAKTYLNTLLPPIK